MIAEQGRAFDRRADLGADFEGELSAAPNADLSADLGPDLVLPHAVMTASGCAGTGPEVHRFVPVTDLGAFVTPTLLPTPRSGRPTPRMAQTPSGLLTSLGWPGPGIERFADDDLTWLHEQGARVIVSVGGETPEQFAYVTRVLRNSRSFSAVVALEVNLCIPDAATPGGGSFATAPEAAAAVLEQLAAEVPPDLPVFAKLSPDVADIVAVADAALASGATGLTAIGAPSGMVIDPVRLRPQLAHSTGGLSGPAIRPIAVLAVWQLRAAMDAGRIPAAPIIGVGGIGTAGDALQFVAAGADAVQIGTAAFSNPSVAREVVAGLGGLVAATGARRLADLVGIAHRGGLPADAYGSKRHEEPC